MPPLAIRARIQSSMARTRNRATRLRISASPTWVASGYHQYTERGRFGVGQVSPFGDISHGRTEALLLLLVSSSE